MSCNVKPLLQNSEVDKSERGWFTVCIEEYTKNHCKWGKACRHCWTHAGEWRPLGNWDIDVRKLKVHQKTSLLTMQNSYVLVHGYFIAPTPALIRVTSTNSISINTAQPYPYLLIDTGKMSPTSSWVILLSLRLEVRRGRTWRVCIVVHDYLAPEGWMCCRSLGEGKVTCHVRELGKI